MRNLARVVSLLAITTLSCAAGCSDVAAGGTTSSGAGASDAGTSSQSVATVSSTNDTGAASTSGAGGAPMGPNVTDVDANSYTSVTIGTQTWMVENLKTTRLNDGAAIAFAVAGADWLNLGAAPGYSWPNDMASNKEPYGALYNWYAVNSGKLCPIGWHIASGAEWDELVMFLGGPMVPPYLIATPKLYTGSGFQALPSGFIDEGGNNSHFAASGGWWTSSESDMQNAQFYYFDSFAVPPYTEPGGNYGFGSKTQGFSVRCLRN